MSKDTNKAASYFEYSSLQQGQIRILQLAPGKKEDALVGHLITTQLDESTIAYDALSYMWGDPTPTDLIWISDKALPIAGNLKTALTHLRYEHRPLIIWIDAICINQNDDAERAVQVQLMRRLYKGANTVRIWIDEPGVDSSSEAMIALQNLVKKNLNIHSNIHELLEIVGEDPGFWDPVLPLFKTKYWKRAWIQQEILNAAKLSLHSGDVVIAGESVVCFKKAVLWLDKMIQMSSDQRAIAWGPTCDDIVHAAPTDEVSYTLEERSDWSLSELMTVKVNCSRPQDRVYSIMHLADDYEEGGITVDYSKSMLEVAIDVAAYHVRRHRDVRFLRIAYLRNTSGPTKRSARQPDETTWMPRAWCGYRKLMALQYSEGVETLTSCSANAVSIAERRLRLCGIRVDRVMSCLTANYNTEHPTAEEFWDSALGRHLQKYVGVEKQELPDQTCKALLGDEDFCRHLLQISLTDRNPQHANDTLNIDVWKVPASEVNQLLREVTVSALEVILQMSKDPEQKHRRMYKGADHNLQLFTDVHSTTVLVLRQMFRHLRRSMVIMTESGDLGRITDCDLEMGDEVWVVMGCDDPIIVRQLPSGRYWHVCAAQIPAIQEHKLIQNLSDDIQPGGRIGEWMVEDIELE